MFVLTQFSKAIYSYTCQWEVFIDTPSPKYGVFGRVTTQAYVARPTKRQIRKLKKAHRQLIKRREQSECNVYGL